MFDKKATPKKRRLAVNKEVLLTLTPDLIRDVHGGYVGSAGGITCGTSCPCKTAGCPHAQRDGLGDGLPGGGLGDGWGGE